MREYKLHYQKNIRDLGGLIGYQGKKVKFGRIFRGGFLDRVAPEDVPILESFKLTDIVDFRGKEEFENRPDYVLKGVTYHNFPVIQEKVNKEDLHNEDGNLLWFIKDNRPGHDHMMEVYQETVTTPRGIEAYKNFFKVLLEDNRVTYFHCSQGKDRAGIAAFLIEMALGVDLEVAKEDYLRSNLAMEHRVEMLIEQVKNKPFYDEKYKKSMYDVFSAKIEYLEATIAIINEKYGSILDYLKNVLEVDIDRLRKLYLE